MYTTLLTHFSHSTWLSFNCYKDHCYFFFLLIFFKFLIYSNIHSWLLSSFQA